VFWSLLLNRDVAHRAGRCRSKSIEGLTWRHASARSPTPDKRSLSRFERRVETRHFDLDGRHYLLQRLVQLSRYFLEDLTRLQLLLLSIGRQYLRVARRTHPFD
jgi:hypothetical protein